jgi:hypothetical protein
MSYADTVSRVSAIEAQIAALQTAFVPPSTSTSTSSATSTGSGSSSFSDALSQAQQSGLSMGTNQSVASSAGLSSTAGATSSGGAALSSTAQGMLTSDQQQFASRLAADTGLNPNVVSAWLLAEESGGAAQSRQSAGNNDWLNIGYTDSATYGSSDSIWGNPLTAADATAGWLKGQNTIPGYGTASSGIQGILNTAGQSPQAQISALQNSGWASSGYPDLPSLLAQVGG